MQSPAYPRRDSAEWLWMRAHPEEWLEMRARSTDPATSHEAAGKMDAEGQRERIMRLMRFMARCGWTADELDEVIGWRVTTAGRRLSELKRRGLVEACGQRYTRSGRQATVYRACA